MSESVKLSEEQFEVLHAWIRAIAMQSSARWPEPFENPEPYKRRARIAFGLPEHKEDGHDHHD